MSDLSTVKGELKLFHKRLLATHPMSSASNERSFSNLKRIETYLRNSVGEARLNGLAMLSIHRDIDVDLQTVITIDDDLNC